MTIEHDGGRWQRLQPRERALIIIVGVIAILAVVYLLFLSGGSGKPEAEATLPPIPRSTATATAPPVSSVPQTFDVFEGKDPFRPLVSVGGGVGPTPLPTSSPGSSGGPTGRQRVTLIDISGSGAARTATVDVDSTEYRVKEGDTFAGSYRVKNLTSGCGTFVFGDETFTLCTGQEVLK